MTVDTARFETTTLSDDVVHDYLRTIRTAAVLSREAVRDLCIAIEVGVLAAERSAAPDLSAADRRDLALLQRRGIAAQRRLITHNLKLVVSVARRSSARAFDFEDLIQAGNAGLVAAVQRFDWTLGFAFSTYATWWIRKAVSAEVANDRTIRLPAGALQQLLDILRFERATAETSARPASTAEVAEATGLDPDRVVALRRVGSSILSLAQPLMSEGETALSDVLPASGPALEDALHEQQVLDALESALDGLPPLHRSIVEQRYGLGVDAPRTPHRIAQLHHLPIAETRSLEQDALDSLAVQLRHLYEH